MKRLHTLIRRLRDDTGGLALIEFAFVAPLLMTAVAGGMEVSNIAIARVRTQQVATAAADAISRYHDTIDETDVNEALGAAKMIGSNISFSQNGRLIVSSVERNAANNGYWFRWQRCVGAKNFSATPAQGAGQSNNSIQSFGPGSANGTTAGGVQPGASTVVIYVIATYDYQPLFGNYLFGNQTFTDERAFVVRDRATGTMTNTTGAAISDCTVFAA